MKQLIAISLLSLAIPAYPQTLVPVVKARAYAGPAAARSAMDGASYLSSQQARMSLIPARVSDRAVYALVYQPHVYEDCVPYSATSPLPPIEGPRDANNTSVILLDWWQVASFQTLPEAKAFYDASLSALQRGTAAIHSTVATNSPFIVVYQKTGLVIAYDAP